MMNEELKLSSPWMIFYKEIDALFKGDPDVRVEYDEDANTIKLYVENAEKADALAQLLPAEKAFGNITVRIMVIPANVDSPSKLQLFQKAFEGNPAFVSTQTAKDGLYDLGYVVFQCKVVQFFSDDLGDLNGLKSTLYQDIAKDIFENAPGVFFCTEPAKSE